MKRTTKALSFLIAAVLVLAAVIVPTIAEGNALTNVGYSASLIETVDLTSVADIKDYEANATATEFKVTDADGWIAFDALVEGGNTLENVTIYVANDINFTGKTVTPIGNHSLPGATATVTPSAQERTFFKGTLDGQGHKFTNLVMEYKITAEMATIALIAGLDGDAVVKNLILDSSCSFAFTGTEIKSPDNYALCAGFVGFGNAGTVRIENCWNKADVTSSHTVTAGIFARKAAAEIKNCTNTGTITASKNVAGGIFAGGNDGTPVNFTNCINYGDVNAAGAYAGGICGRTEKSTTITNCVNGGAINNTNASGVAAGIIVVSKNATIKLVNCTNYGLITAPAKNGLIAVKSSVTVTEKEWSGNQDLYGIATLPPVETTTAAPAETTTAAPAETTTAAPVETTTAAPVETTTAAPVETTTAAPAITEAPNTDAPATDAPATDAPATDAPATDAPATDAPIADAPATDAPTVAPTDTPTEAPTDAPATDVATGEVEKKGGCSATVIGGISVIMLVSAAAITLFKKEEK